MTKIRKLKSTLTVGVIFVTVLLMRETGTLLFRLPYNNKEQFQTNFNGCLNPDNYLDRHFFRMKSDLIVYDINSKWLSDETTGEKENHCIRTLLLLKEYKKKDFVRCVDSLSTRKKGRPITFAFIGDSTVRQLFTRFTQWIPDYDLMTRHQHTDDNGNAYHNDVNLTSRLLSNLKVSFYWRPLIKDDMLTIFRRWASTKEHIQVPDFILFGATVHHMIVNNNISFQVYEKLLENELVPLMKQSLIVHPHQKIIWLKQSLTIHHHMNGATKPHPDKINKYNAILPRVLKNTGILIWDSINALTEEYIHACFLTRYGRQDRRLYENCKDMIHSGFVALSLGTQLFINNICESVKENEIRPGVLLAAHSKPGQP